MTDYFKHKMRGRKFGTIIGWVLLGIVAIIGFALLFGFGIMWLWNWLMPDLFGLMTINYWQAVGIFVMAKILFGFGGGGGHHNSKKGKSKNRCIPTNRDSFRSDFSQWKFYEEFWEAEGQNAYKEYVTRIQEDKQ